ncbi:hypothetical protein LAX5112_01002 [Roseibium alexandrii]|uniref:Uncharacterized protein n=1 Tax=Roseibium alexandrii TaxID=388408 RepID=A0A0M6ZWB2_9HYPH|nr:hypothetical protein LAX5112_01002 [Roseibium alexandrii]
MFSPLVLKAMRETYPYHTLLFVERVLFKENVFAEAGRFQGAEDCLEPKSSCLV